MHKKRSVNSIFFSNIAVAVIPLFLLVLFLFLYTLSQNIRHSRELTSRNAESIGDSIYTSYTDMKSNVEKSLYCMDFIMMSNNSNPQILYRRMQNLSEKLKSVSSVYDEVMAVVLYNQKSDYAFPVYTHSSAPVLDEPLKELLRSLPPEHSRTDSVLSVKGSSFLLFRVTERYGTVLIVMDPSRNRLLGAYNSLSDPREDFFFRAAAEADSTHSADAVFFPTRIDSLGLSLCTARNSFSFLRQINLLQWILLLLIILLTIGLILDIRYLQNRLLRPLRYLSDAFRIISAENPDYRIDRESRITEVDTFYRGFNEMLDNTEKARAESHENQMDAVRAKLQYLQLQIRPHFYLNCLKSVYSLSQMGETEKMQQLILDLSEYLRYTFRDVKNFVPLRTELQAVESYVNLCSNIYSEVEMEYELSPEVMDAQCLPLSFLTFVENAVKHGMGDGLLKIRIEIGSTEEDGLNLLYAVIRNSGSFSVEDLKLLNEADPSHIEYRRDHVGISNVRYRLWLLYGNASKLQFRNEGGFACVRILFPFQQY